MSGKYEGFYYFMLPVVLYITPALLAIGILGVMGIELKSPKPTADYNVTGILSGIVFSTICYMAIAYIGLILR